MRLAISSPNGCLGLTSATYPDSDNERHDPRPGVHTPENSSSLGWFQAPEALTGFPTPRRSHGFPGGGGSSHTRYRIEPKSIVSRGLSETSSRVGTITCFGTCALCNIFFGHIYTSISTTLVGIYSGWNDEDEFMVSSSNHCMSVGRDLCFMADVVRSRSELQYSGQDFHAPW